jgi:hypothetical protein
MNSLFSGIAARAATNSARSVLTTLMASFGSVGLAAAADHPGLLAAIDQHAAAIRDRLLADQLPIGTFALAGYAEGVRDAAMHHGWQPPDGPIDWHGADWVLTRLLAVCALANGGYAT